MKDIVWNFPKPLNDTNSITDPFTDLNERMNDVEQLVPSHTPKPGDQMIEAFDTFLQELGADLMQWLGQTTHLFMTHVVDLTSVGIGIYICWACLKYMVFSKTRFDKDGNEIESTNEEHSGRIVLSVIALLITRLCKAIWF